jgi:transcriptional regulator with XRE-family HTH domain
VSKLLKQRALDTRWILLFNTIVVPDGKNSGRELRTLPEKRGLGLRDLEADMVNDGKRFGGVLRDLRKRRGLSLRELAKKADLIHSNLSSMEAGRTRVGLKVFHRLWQALAETESEKLELGFAFAASRIGETSSETKADLDLKLMRHAFMFARMGLDLCKFGKLKEMELPRRPERESPERVLFAFEKGTERLEDRLLEALIDSLSKTKNDRPPLVIIRRNGRATLFQGRDIDITP